MSAWVVRATQHLKFNLQRRGVASLWKRCQAGTARPPKLLLMSLAHWATSPAFNGKLNFMSTVIPLEKECLTTSIYVHKHEHADALEIEPHFAKPPSQVPRLPWSKWVGEPDYRSPWVAADELHRQLSMKSLISAGGEKLRFATGTGSMFNFWKLQNWPPVRLVARKLTNNNDGNEQKESSDDTSCYLFHFSIVPAKLERSL